MHRDDALSSVVLIVKKMQDEQNNLILVYKPVGEAMPSFPNISNDEFHTGIMNDSPQELLKLYNHYIMIDSIYGMNQYGFQLTKFMAHDENHEGLQWWKKL